MKQPDDRSRRCFLKASSMLGLAAVFSPATIGEAFADLKSKTTLKENTMTQASRYTTRVRAGKCNSSVSRETDDGARHSRALPHSGRAELMPCVLTGADRGASATT
jgi:hypothetical protein